MRLLDTLRTLVGIRSERQLLPVSEKPFIGSNIVRDKLRMRLKYPINDELWKWLSEMGWRAIDMRGNRRHYTVVPDKILVKLIKANTLERHILHNRLLKATKFERSSPAYLLAKNNLKKSPHKAEWEFDTNRAR